MAYDNYIGAAGQYTAVDLRAAEEAIVALASSEDLRRKMGAEAQARARQIFDWAVIIPQYEALWAEQNARRSAAAPAPVHQVNPFAPDPFTLFSRYPSRHLGRGDTVSLTSGLSWDAAQAILGAPLAAYSALHRPNASELQAIFSHLSQGPATVGALRDLFEPARKNFIERGLIWLVRYGILEVRQAP
jgi:hypothetical protein